MKKIKKLYTGFSFLNNFRDKNMVLVDWFKVGAMWKGVNYDKIVRGYKRMPEARREMARIWANEFFTKDEINVLRRLLKADFDTHLVAQEVILPMDFIGHEAGQDSVSYEQISHAGNTIFLDRYERARNLSFKVWGHFDENECLPSAKLPLEMKVNGKEYLERALKLVLADASSSAVGIPDELIETLYREHGLYVGWSNRGLESNHPTGHDVQMSRSLHRLHLS
jgi:hypothetical protein